MNTINGLHISVKNLTWSYGDKKVLDNVCMNIEKAKFYSIIGPNGSGKTTLLKNISKNLEPGWESVFVEENDIMKLKNKDIAKKISTVPQNTNVSFDFSVMDIVLMGRSPYFRRFQSESDYDLDIAKKAMISTNIWHLKDKNINEVSGGERQRVVIARALTQQASIMLLDEPVSQLDIHHQIELMDTVKALTIKEGITALAVLHDLNLAAQYSDYLILVNQGNIVSQGTPEQVLTRENVELVYDMDVYIMANPVTGNPHVIPIRSKKTGMGDIKGNERD